MTRMDRLSREAAQSLKRLKVARDRLSEARYEHNETLRLLCQAWDSRMERKHV